MNVNKVFAKIGPAIIAVGFAIGTGSVTTFIVAGSKYGTDLLFINVFACLFSWACCEAYDRFYLATGLTALRGIKTYIPYGGFFAWMIIIGLSFGQYNALMGNLSTTANAIFETFNVFFPALGKHAYLIILGLAIANVGIMTYVLNIGKFKLFEKVVSIFVILMSFCFIISLFIAPPNPTEVLKGILPKILHEKDKVLLSVAMVGTTLSAATFISRPLFLQASNWTKKDRVKQKNDAILANVGLLIIGASILLLASSTLFKEGKEITKVIDMVGVLEPLVGKFATVVFLTGTLSAGLSSIFPILMITPMMVQDIQTGKFEMGTKQFKILIVVAALIGLIGPILGGNPIEFQVFSQVFLVLVLPITILLIMILVNNKTIMKDLKSGWFLNTCLVLAFIFSMIITYNGVIGIYQKLSLFLTT
ncbi:MAG: Nramp family divalent metal transporter [Spirosomaceae bacterium]|nr:Nramp family divalent metal transporter [Spirosomataceae bacterium]MDP5138906.1 Nramp family divalent metal transporter [Spirosomataceae bacterium]